MAVPVPTMADDVSVSSANEDQKAAEASGYVCCSLGMV